MKIYPKKTHPKIYFKRKIMHSLIFAQFLYSPTYARPISHNERLAEKLTVLEKLSINHNETSLELNIINKLLYSIYFRSNNFSVDDAIDINTLAQITSKDRLTKSIKLCLKMMQPIFFEEKNRLQINCNNALIKNIFYNCSQEEITKLTQAIAARIEKIKNLITNCSESDFAEFALNTTSFLYILHIFNIHTYEQNQNISFNIPNIMLLLFEQNLSNYENYSFFGLHADENFKKNMLILANKIIPKNDLCDKIEYHKIWNNHLFKELIAESEQNIFKTCEITDKDILARNNQLLELAYKNHARSKNQMNINGNNYLDKQDIFMAIYSVLLLYNANKYKHGKEFSLRIHAKLNDITQWLEAKYNNWDFYITTFNVFFFYPILVILIVDLILRHALGDALYILSWVS